MSKNLLWEMVSRPLDEDVTEKLVDLPRVRQPEKPKGASVRTGRSKRDHRRAAGIYREEYDGTL